MASDRKRRQALKRLRELQSPPTGPFRHRDGDRRRRQGPSAREAIARKRWLQQFGGYPPPDAEPEGDRE